LTEEDWGLLLKWNSDPDVLYCAEGDDVTSRTLEEIQRIYRGVSQSAYCFIIKYNSVPIGECWLQQMNLERILQQFPGQDIRRADIMIGEKSFWGQGIGTEVIRMLVEFGFAQEHADAIFACDVADYNLRSLRAFQKAGFQVQAVVPQPTGSKAQECYDLIIRRDQAITP